MDMRAWIGYICLKIGAGGVRLWTQNEPPLRDFRFSER